MCIKFRPDGRLNRRLTGYFIQIVIWAVKKGAKKDKGQRMKINAVIKAFLTLAVCGVKSGKKEDLTANNSVNGPICIFYIDFL